MPKVPKEELKKGVKAEVAPSRSVKSMFGRFHKTFVSLTLASALSACSPAVANADAKGTTPVDKKPVAAALEKKVEYQTFSDPNDLSDYLKKAEGKVFQMKHMEVRKMGDYSITAKEFMSAKLNTTFEIRVDGSEEVQRIPLDKLKNTKILFIAETNTLLLTDNETAFFIRFNEETGKFEGEAVPFWSAKMREGNLAIGYDVIEDGTDVFISPEKLKTGDLVPRVSWLTNGKVGVTIFQYTGPDTETKTVAMR